MSQFPGTAFVTGNKNQFTFSRFRPIKYKACKPHRESPLGFAFEKESESLMR